MYILILIAFVNGQSVAIDHIPDIATFGRCHQIRLAVGAELEPPRDGLFGVCQPRKDLSN